MTKEFIQKYCVYCDRCIYTDGVPLFCGEIDDEGCVSEEIKDVQHCYYGNAPVPHIPRFKPSDVLEAYPHNIEILSIEGDEYMVRRQGTFGRFEEPYPVEYFDIEETDDVYELYQPEEDGE